MWVANAATVSASRDTADGRVHFTPANLATHFHRALEAPDHDARSCARSSRTQTRFAVHDPLPATPQTGDEGAANHTRLTSQDGAGVDFFVYGRRAYGPGPLPIRFPARHTLEASQAVARGHGLESFANACYAQQNPTAIDAGVFHNDVIAVGHRATMLFATSVRGSTATRCSPISPPAPAMVSSRSSCATPT